jgi:uncharacterized protein with ParB-like and HNH nuclease domain
MTIVLILLKHLIWWKQLKKKKILDSISQYQECRAKPSRKNPASEKNLTFAVVGSKSQNLINLSQCIIAVRPAVHPERRACKG